VREKGINRKERKVRKSIFSFPMRRLHPFEIARDMLWARYSEIRLRLSDARFFAVKFLDLNFGDDRGVVGRPFLGAHGPVDGATLTPFS
jgi:hypothetical protein